MKNRLLFYTDNPPVGGVPQYNHSMICKLASSGYQVTVAQIEPPASRKEREREFGIEQIWLEPDLVTGYSRSYTDLDTPKKIISTVKPDLIFFSDGWPLANFAAKQIAIEMEIPYIIVVGYVDSACAGVFRDDGIPYQEVVSYHYNCARSVSAVSQENLSLLHNLFNVAPEHSGVVHYGRPESYFLRSNPTERKRLRAEIGVPEYGVICFTAARMASVKGFEYQLQAIEQLKILPIWHRLYFVWAGSGVKGENIEPKLRQKVKDLGVESQVKFLGEREDIPDLLGASDIFVLPSKAEGMPIGIMEAMAKGLPIIASSVSGIPEELGDTGKLLPNPNFVPQDTVTELISTIAAWASNDELRNAIGLACHQRATLMFTEERMFHDYLVIIDRVLNSLDFDRSNLERIERLFSQSKDILTSRVNYAYLVWKAWSNFNNTDLTDTINYLAKSWDDSPFLPTETVLNWVECLAKFSGESGAVEPHKQFNFYSVASSSEWTNLIEDKLNLLIAER